MLILTIGLSLVNLVDAQRREYLPTTKLTDCYKACGATGKCTSVCGTAGYCCNQDRFAFPYCKAEMAEAIKFLEPTKKHHVCVAPFACAEVLGVYKKKVYDLNIQNAFYKRLGLDSLSSYFLSSTIDYC